MAERGYLESLIGGLPAEQRKVWKQVFEYLLTNFRLGTPVDMTRATNLQAYFYEATTPATADEEFSIAHGLGVVPYLLMPVLPLQDENAQLVPLTVTRPADANRVYLSSSETSAPIRLLIEG